MSPLTKPAPICGISWTENGELRTDGKPAVAVAHLYYRENAEHPSLEIPVCQDHYNQIGDRKYDVGLGARSPAPVHVAVTYTALPIQISISPGSQTLAPGETLQFYDTVTGTTDTTVTWSAQQGTIDQTGFYTAPSVSTATVDTITARSNANRCVWATAQVSIAAPVSVIVVVSPQSATVAAGSAPMTFHAVVNGITDQTVTWSVQGGASGQVNEPGLGTVNPTTGVYTPPASSGVQAFDDVIATSVGFPAASSFSVCTINPNVAVTVTPSSLTVGVNGQQQFNAVVAGIGNQNVIWSARLGTITPAGMYTAPATAGTDTITATSAAIGSAIAAVAVNVTSSTVTVVVTVSPPGITLNPGQTQQFTSTVTGLTNTAVVWTVTGGTTGTAAVGTISSTGLYTAPVSAIVHSFDTVVATPVGDPSVSGVASVAINAGGAAQLDLVQWMLLSQRASQHLVGDPSAPYSVQMIDTDPGYPTNFPKGLVWQIKNKLGNPWDVHTYNSNFITHWITDDGDAVDQPLCQAANGTSCWMYARSYKRYLTPVNVMPRYFVAGTTITIDNPGSNTVNATTDCETTIRTVTIGPVRGITTGPFKISWGGSIDHGTGTLASGPNYDSVNGVDTIRVQYQYTGNPTSGFQDSEEYYYVLGFGEVAWYHFHGGVYQQKTVNTTLAATGAPVPNFPCGPGKTWFV